MRGLKPEVMKAEVAGGGDEGGGGGDEGGGGGDEGEGAEAAGTNLDLCLYVALAYNTHLLFFIG